MKRRLLDRAAMMLLAGAGLATYLPLEAQDIETLARLRGLELPAGYYERVREDPTAFTLPNGLFRISPEGRSASRTEGRADIPVILALFSDSEEPHITQERSKSRSLMDPRTMARSQKPTSKFREGRSPWADKFTHGCGPRFR